LSHNFTVFPLEYRSMLFGACKKRTPQLTNREFDFEEFHDVITIPQRHGGRTDNLP